MSIKNRIAKLEKSAPSEKPGDALSVRKVDYRAGIVPGVEEPPDAIPLRLADYMRREDDDGDSANA